MAAAGIAVVIAVIFVVMYVNSNNLIKHEIVTKDNSVLDQSAEQNTTITEKQIVMQEVNATGTYRLDTECQLVYGIANGVYPNGERLPAIKISELLIKYPEEFKPWKEILENKDNRTAFFKKTLPSDFRSVLTIAMMKESSINPRLEQIALIVTDSHGKEKLQQAFKEFECQKYFDERKK